MNMVVCDRLAQMVGDCSEMERAERDNPDEPSIDVVFDILSDRQRRHILASLLDHGQDIAMSALAEDIAARDSGPPRSEVPAHTSGIRREVPEDTIHRITTSLYHLHIPKLEEARVVEYDPDRDIVRAAESANRIENILALTELLS